MFIRFVAVARFAGAGVVIYIVDGGMNIQHRQVDSSP